MSTSQTYGDGWILFLIICAALVIGFVAGEVAGKHYEQKRTVIDQQHLIYDSELYKKVVPNEDN